MSKSPESNDKPSFQFLRKRDLWILCVLVLAAALVFGVMQLTSRKDHLVASVSVGLQGSQQITELELSPDRIVEIDGKLPVYLEIRDDAIRFVDSVCPDHDCEGFGWLHTEGDWAACLPAEVVVRLEAA